MEDTLLTPIRKILNEKTLNSYLKLWDSQDKKIVFTNGCFDLLHLGHVDYLSKSKQLGDILFVGVNTDSSVKRIKGKKRPINDEISRSMILSSLMFVDAVMLFNEETPYELIKKIKPDILVKGGDYNLNEMIGSDIVLSKGGKIEIIDFLEGYSTTKIIDKINSLK